MKRLTILAALLFAVATTYAGDARQFLDSATVNDDGTIVTLPLYQGYGIRDTLRQLCKTHQQAGRGGKQYRRERSDGKRLRVVHCLQSARYCVAGNSRTTN